MNEANALPRSPQLMRRDDTGLLVVDVQEKLIGLISDHQRIVWNIRRLIDAAECLGVPVAGTEQYPKGLGPTVEPLAGRLGEIPAKVSFSCGSCGAVFDAFRARQVEKLLVVGIETHVCVQQTVFDTMAAGFQVFVAADAVGTRHPIDHDVALRRMDSGGATITTTESAMFEWCAAAEGPEFKTISQLIRESPPKSHESHVGVVAPKEDEE